MSGEIHVSTEFVFTKRELESIRLDYGFSVSTHGDGDTLAAFVGEVISDEVAAVIGRVESVTKDNPRAARIRSLILGGDTNEQDAVDIEAEEQ